MEVCAKQPGKLLPYSLLVQYQAMPVGLPILVSYIPKLKATKPDPPKSKWHDGQNACGFWKVYERRVRAFDKTGVRVVFWTCRAGE